MRKVNIPMALACVLFCLTLITTHMTGGLFARYTATADSGDDARVAKFHVVAPKPEDVTIDSAQDKNGEYVITVTNHSEVAVRYSVVLTLDQLVDATNLIVKIGEAYPAQVGEVYTFSDLGQLAPNGASATHAVTFGVDKWETVTGKMEVMGEPTFDWELGFTVDIIAEQID